MNDAPCVACRAFPVRCHDCLSCDACCTCALHVEPSNRVPDPSLDEIRERCLEIQATWSEATRLDRMGANRPQAWTTPTARSTIAEPTE